MAHNFGTPTSSGLRIELPVIQQGIGNLVRTSRLTVNQILVEFEANGWLAKKGNRWIIYDLDAIRRIVTSA